MGQSLIILSSLHSHLCDLVPCYGRARGIQKLNNWLKNHSWTCLTPNLSKLSTMPRTKLALDTSRAVDVWMYPHPQLCGPGQVPHPKTLGFVRCSATCNVLCRYKELENYYYQCHYHGIIISNQEILQLLPA
jgi:hypothetical protein